MKTRILQVKRFFDGFRFVEGLHTIEIADGIIRTIRPGTADAPHEEYDFLMPTLTESHCHLFLDGDERDNAVRKAHLAKTPDQLVKTGMDHLARYREAGIRTVRDAGDVYGVNHRLRTAAGELGMRVVSAGKAVRKIGRYGSFMARELAGPEDIPAAVAEIARDADALKIVLSGIIDFAHGQVKGEPQFSSGELDLLVKCAREHGLKTFVHCSGVEALRLAIAAGVDSIEHGFFMTPDLVRAMADRQIAWTPTFLPVEFQYREPQYGNWDAPTRAKLREILDNHAANLRLAEELDVPVMAGSDAGSFGVPHGSGLVEELQLMLDAGMSRAAVLAGATSRPQAHFGLAGGRIAVGSPADFRTDDPLSAGN